MVRRLGIFVGMLSLCGAVTEAPTPRPTKTPTTAPTQRPTKVPTTQPTFRPTKAPTTARPTKNPVTRHPTKKPTAAPTGKPVTPQPTDLCLSSSCPSALGQNSLLNGDFDNVVTPFDCKNGGGFNDICRTAVLPGWTVTVVPDGAPGSGLGSIDLLFQSYWQPATGGYSLDMNGGGQGTITQDFCVTMPGMFRLRYYLSKNTSRTTASIKVVILDPNGAVTFADDKVFNTPNSNSDMKWTLVTNYVGFLACGTYTISFQSTVDDFSVSGGGPALDGVSIQPTQQVPTDQPTQVPTDQPTHVPTQAELCPVTPSPSGGWSCCSQPYWCQSYDWYLGTSCDHCWRTLCDYERDNCCLADYNLGRECILAALPIWHPGWGPCC